MTATIESLIRQIVRDELERAEHPKYAPRLVPQPDPIRVEMPLRPGEVERHYPVSEVARLLGMSREWVYDRLKDGTFVTANFGAGKSKKRIPASSINEFIKAHTYS